jgi:hypothetical protein
MTMTLGKAADIWMGRTVDTPQGSGRVIGVYRPNGSTLGLRVSVPGARKHVLIDAPTDEGSLTVNASSKNAAARKSTASKKETTVKKATTTTRKASTTTTAKKATTAKAKATTAKASTRRTDVPDLDEHMELRIVQLTQDGRSRKEISEALGGYPIYRIWAAQAKAGLTKNSPKLMARAEGVGKPKGEAKVEPKSVAKKASARKRTTAKVTKVDPKALGAARTIEQVKAVAESTAPKATRSRKAKATTAA